MQQLVATNKMRAANVCVWVLDGTHSSAVELWPGHKEPSHSLRACVQMQHVQI